MLRVRQSKVFALHTFCILFAYFLKNIYTSDEKERRRTENITQKHTHIRRRRNATNALFYKRSSFSFSSRRRKTL